MTNWEGLNRRKFPRANYPCLVIIREGEEKNIILTHTENIGIGGVCLTLKKSIEMFNIVNLEVDLLDLEEHIKCQGKIVWNFQRKVEEKDKPLFYDIGVEFVDLDENNHQRLEKIISRLVKQR